MIKFTVFTDLHYDEVSDGDRRIDELVEHIKDTKPDFVVSLGDLCKPVTKNCETVLKKLYSVDVPVYHTIGNHETDTCEIETTAKFLSLKNTYYSFGYGDVKFIVLDSCFFRKNGKEYPYYKKNYKKENMIFPVVPSEEIEWLNQQLNDKKKYVIFSHHSLVNDYKNRGIYNRNEIRKLLEDKEVLLCMNGHDHGDELAVVNDIPYYTVNSATYIWCGSQIDASQELREKYKHLNGILLYKQALCVDVEIDESEIRILGMNGEYLSVTPDDVGLCDYKWNGVSIRPRTSSYMIKIDNRK